MAEFIFDYPEQIEALYKCGVPFDEAVEIVKSGSDFDRLFECVEEHFGPFVHSKVTLMPYYEVPGIYFTEEDVKNGNMELPEWFQKQVKGEKPEQLENASGDIDLPF